VLRPEDAGGGLVLSEAITGPRIVAIARGLDPARLDRIATGLVEGGVRAFEVTLDSPGAVDAIRTLVASHGRRGLLVGAGTVLDVAAAFAAAAAGAGFLVSPHTDPAIIEWAVRHGVPVLPGAATPTEALTAWRAGATAVKVFPASALGPAFVREVRGPFREIPLVATGGITPDTGPAFIAAGAAAVGVGSWLSGDGEPEGIAARAARLVRALAAPG
jgi:2-dehydro-3-deoxyphosphogluconate aldolase/(4S)-4-hydroxy-2-oxoglutarate aldolase